MNEKQIKERIEQIESIIEKTEVTILNYDFVIRLMELHHLLWDFLYFKVNQEKDFLKKWK